MSDPLRIIVLGRMANPRVRSAWHGLSEFLKTQPVDKVRAREIDEERGFDGLDADLVVVLGGDGAILRACRQMGARQLPIIGVNLGRLGFLADLSPDEFCRSFDEIRNRRFDVVEHLMFECRLKMATGEEHVHLGLNEVAVLSADSLRMIDVHLSIDDEPVTTYSGDGLIVSTPVGSTAHNLAAGGPILRQNLQAFAITPICPHTLTNRPVVDSADRVYRLTVPDAPEGIKLLIDGQIKLPLQSGDLVEIRQAPVTFKLAKIPGHSYYATLHRKLGWGGQTPYQGR
jgi:NAD+ kinase